MQRKGFTLIVLLIIGLILSSFIFVGAKFLNKPPKSTNIQLNKPQKQETSYPNFFINYIPNFENLKISDVPSIENNARILDYGNKQIIITSGKGVSTWKAIEYDKSTNSIVGINDTKYYENISSAVIISNYMYVFVRKYTSNYGNIYKVNLDSGSTEKQINFVNDSSAWTAGLATFDGNLWISTWSKIYKVNPIDDSYSTYNYQDFAKLVPVPADQSKQQDTQAIKSDTNKSWPPKSAGRLGSTNEPPTWQNRSNECLGSLYVRNDQLTLSTCDDNVYFIYDKNTDHWIYKNDVNLKNTKNLTSNVNNIDLPQYFSISNFVNGKYYLTSAEGIYLLTKGFPKKYLNLDSEWSLDNIGKSSITGTPINDKFLVTPDEKYALVFVLGTCIGPKNGGYHCDYPLSIKLINLKTKEINNFQNPNNIVSQEKFDHIKNSNLKEKDRQLVITDNKFNDELVVLDLTTKTFQLGK